MKRQLEPPIFEKGSVGRSGVDVAVGSTDIPLDASLLREELDGFPEVSEPEVVRHYVRLSQLNYSAATNFYPLGSCTMKYNPVANERAAALAGFAGIHPYAPDATVQGALALIRDLEQWLCEISGLQAVSLQPAAGAQGELTGMKIIRAFHESHGRARKKVLIPESAHGTNPASATLCGYDSVSIPSDARGLISAQAVRDRIDEDVAALMVTNPNTLGLFEEDIVEIAEIVHGAGGLIYMDGANMNALMGVAKPGHMGADVLQFNLHKTFSTPHGGGGPGSGPVAVRADLEPFLPRPRVIERDGRLAWEWNRPQSIGKVRSFYGNFGILVRAWSYMLANGGDGLTEATRTAVLAANYVKARLRGRYHLAYDRPCMHEVVLTDRIQARLGVKTLDVAKRLLDYGFHAPTIYFPLVVAGALMIEPTETESLETLDDFIEAMECIAGEAETEPAKVREAPHETVLSRLDETRAARFPVLTWSVQQARP
ncbi:MAG TPA: aminomethyl-transferring glycine dehydrogenase subunit GcvPB [Candidatus Limnocylindrales bacterium]|nr:aminomethyl-transferring glycine dehydrogenase subunit GcvPB [Candidatus Limnocylindrales bacterium]